MTLDEYQRLAKSTDISAGDQLTKKTIYALGIAGESGEIADKWKKVLVYQNGSFASDDVHEIQKEIGDVLWYLALLADSLGLSFEEVAQANLDKLESRKQRDVIKGRGDNR